MPYTLGARCALLLLLSLASAPAQSVPKEYQLRAVMLFRFAQFVEWPPLAFESPTSPLVIGVLGENPFGEAVEVAVRGETAHGHPIRVEYFHQPQDIKACHILYISRSETGHVKEILRSLAGRSILTVSDIEGFALERGGVVRFVAEPDRVTIRINLESAKTAGLLIDSRLLRLAQIAKAR